MTKREFIYPGKKMFNNRYLVSITGRVFTKDGKELNYHQMPNGGRFVRLCGGNCIVRSISVAKMVLLTYNPWGLTIKRNLAIHLDGDITNDRRENLFWGSRKDQSTIVMRKKSNFDRVSKMSKKYYLSLKNQQS